MSKEKFCWSDVSFTQDELKSVLVDLGYIEVDEWDKRKEHHETDIDDLDVHQLTVTWAIEIETRFGTLSILKYLFRGLWSEDSLEIELQKNGILKSYEICFQDEEPDFSCVNVSLLKEKLEEIRTQLNVSILATGQKRINDLIEHLGFEEAMSFTKKCFEDYTNTKGNRNEN